ncbi:13055_t:CDS:2, partial [Cetraspora pellucida]
NSFSDWNKWSLVSFLEYADEKNTLSFNDKRELHRRFWDSISAILKSDVPAIMKRAIKDLKNECRFVLEFKTDEEIAVAEAEYKHKQAFLELKNRFENKVIESHKREVEKHVNVIIIADMVKALLVLDVFITTSPSDNASTVLSSCYTFTILLYNALQPLSQIALITTLLLFGNAFIALLLYYTFTTPFCNVSQLLLQNTFITTSPF